MTTPYDADEFRTAARAVVDLLADHLFEMNAGGGGTAVMPHMPPAEQVEYWSEQLGGRVPTGGCEQPPYEDPAVLFAEMLERSHHLHHPRYMGHQVAAPFPIAAVADLFSSLLNNGLAVYEMGPVGLATERACVRWMCDKLGYPESADGVFTSGGSLGNLTALLAARQAKAGWNVWREGATGGPALAILVSEQSHYCIARAAQVMGLGAGGVISIKTDAHFRVTATTLAAAHAEARAGGRRPIAAVASCCTTSTGAYDPISVFAEFCGAHDMWLHVDGAHGASVAVSEELRHKVAGIERADSVVWDAHKLLGVPSLSTAVVYRDGGRSYEAFAQEASYLYSGDARENWWDGGHRTLECTRRTLALPLYAVLACYGEKVLAEHVERLHSLADEFAGMVDASADFELAVQPESNIVCFRYAPDGANELDALQARVRETIVRSGAFYIVRTTLPGGIFLRTTIMNPRTDAADFEALMQEIRRVGAQTVASDPPLASE